MARKVEEKKELPEWLSIWLRQHHPKRVDTDTLSVWWLNPCATKSSNGGNCCRVVRDEQGNFTYWCHYGQIEKKIKCEEDLI